MANCYVLQRVEEVEAKVLDGMEERQRVRTMFLRRIAQLYTISETLMPCITGGLAEPVDVERTGVLAIALVEAARAEHAAMVADAETQS